MTNKIIIDGIDVSECDRYIDYTGFTGVYNTPVEEGQCRMPTIHRCEGSECIYKKYKRKKQECEEWKAENKKLKEKFKRFFDIDNQACWNIAFLKDENAKYKQALDEIEEFIKNQLDDFGNDVYNMDKSAINNIQNIIDKAKEQ